MRDSCATSIKWLDLDRAINSLDDYHVSWRFQR